MADRRAGIGDLADDTLGWGGRELTTARDLLVRPAVVLEAWMSGGSDGGGVYARPLRLYLALNAILMLVLFLKGGAGFLLTGLPPDRLAALAAQSGKSVDAFVADADGWMTLIMVPLLSALYATAAAPLLRWWDPEPLGWRRGFRAAFGWLCAWTILILPLSWWSFEQGPAQPYIALAYLVFSLAAFLRVGRGRWFRGLAAGVAKALALTMAVMAAGLVGGNLVVGVGVLAARLMP
ncbi:hypothetical protein [Brevundimonas sp.]|uniref:hypothetical protein n=1 Tax=Brevundimonas sp. TaxID=1871086 RepID=UPI0035B4CB27